jgi:hypothetical protein
MGVKTIEEILVLYQMAVTGRPGAVVDNDPERTKELADAIRRVMTTYRDQITLTGQQLMTCCGFAGIYVDPAVTEGQEEILETEFTIEGCCDVYLAEGDPEKPVIYSGMAIHMTEDPELGYQPLEPDKWPHQDGERDEVREPYAADHYGGGID